VRIYIRTPLVRNSIERMQIVAEAQRDRDTVIASAAR